MKQLIRSKIIRAYEKKIANIQNKYDLGGFMIDISKKTSAYELSWEEFMLLRKKASARATELKISFKY